MSVCPVCSKNVGIGDIYCSNCGAKLIEDVEVIEKPEIVRAPCSRRITLFLAFLFGVVGLHNLYLGEKNKFYLKASLSLVTFGLLAPITLVWAFVEAIIIIRNPDYKDAYGVKLEK